MGRFAGELLSELNQFKGKTQKAAGQEHIREKTQKQQTEIQ